MSPSQPNSELLAIRDDVQRRFQPANPLTKAIARKLIHTIYRQHQFEHLLDAARRFPSDQLDSIPPERLREFRQSMRKLTEQIRELKRSGREYSAALRQSEAN